MTTVLAGNCGFSLAPTTEADRDYITRMFAKVEGMDAVALDWPGLGLRDLPRVPGRRGATSA